MKIDLNADLGEGGQYDEELLAIVSSANISCGAHAGSPEDITKAIIMAKNNNVRIGAHPSYPDRENFGRLPMTLSAQDLRKHLAQQLEFFLSLSATLGAKVHHIKPHGALYNQAARDPELAEQIIQIVKELAPSLSLVGLAGGQTIHRAKEQQLHTVEEMFADRAYHPDGSLLGRHEPGALIDDPERACAQVLSMLRTGSISAIDGSQIRLTASTVCIHGDSPRSLELARGLKAKLIAQRVEIA
ncbi:MAG: 5-oxoprolinase subunit PxpA [Pseudohongiellaceae bacterium]|nr:5-oxoprolinase subunit PxpA [Pseudohongiellaceae bacterium]